MANYKDIIIDILEKAYLDKVLDEYFENDRVTNRTFRLSSSLLDGKFDPHYFTGMNVIIAHLVRKYPTLADRGIEVRSGAPYESRYFGTGDVRLARIRDIKRNYIDLDNATIVPRNQYEKYPVAKAVENDIVVGMDGDEFRAAVVRKEHMPFAINQRIAIIRGLSEDKAIYYALAINSYIGVYQLERVRTYAGTVGHISSSDVSNLRFPFPDDYSEFVKYYKQVVDKIAEHVSNVQQESEGLRREIYARLRLEPSPKIRNFTNL